jgi:hypothetical protein
MEGEVAALAAREGRTRVARAPRHSSKSAGWLLCWSQPGMVSRCPARARGDQTPGLVEVILRSQAKTGDAVRLGPEEPLPRRESYIP